MNLQPGDVVERMGFLGTRHKGIFAGWDRGGRGLVVHNAKNEFVKWDFLQNFAAGLPVKISSRVARNPYEQRLIVKRAQSLLGRPYQLLSFNCDHFVTYAQTGKAQSSQLQAFAGVATSVAILAVFL